MPGGACAPLGAAGGGGGALAGAARDAAGVLHGGEEKSLSRGRRNGPGPRGVQPACVGWYGGIFNQSPNRREPVKRYSQRVIINTHLWEPGEAESK